MLLNSPLSSCFSRSMIRVLVVLFIRLLRHRSPAAQQIMTGEYFQAQKSTKYSRLTLLSLCLIHIATAIRPGRRKDNDFYVFVC